MRWLTLYARSRQVPASLAAVLVGAVAVWALAGNGDGRSAPLLPVFALAAGVTAASVGLGGQDVALDRTAAIRWRVRRTAHVLLIGTVVCAVPLVLGALGEDLATAGFLARDAAGLTGLVAAGAAGFGARYAWTPPIAWLSVSMVTPSPEGLPEEVAGWLLLPPGTPAATWTALALAALGTTVYALAGPKR
ncbi:hypothetical protein [Streptomyces neyagawaensis]|uniref:hypothetical protein n=1 Tax=Streptomyces neyagawaensis TaxID=42238 RepID=UPI0006E2CD2F|nr:hypothetical protein [Streptomyces neyagawaensis]MCL6736149.1 hypothetical protein [Streptomyces neyagawaensis]MDE1688420.1 hypothetical protein [Streptomyces neyagawaensis]